MMTERRQKITMTERRQKIMMTQRGDRTTTERNQMTAKKVDDVDEMQEFLGKTEIDR